MWTTLFPEVTEMVHLGARAILIDFTYKYRTATKENNGAMWHSQVAK